LGKKKGAKDLQKKEKNVDEKKSNGGKFKSPPDESFKGKLGSAENPKGNREKR